MNNNNVNMVPHCVTYSSIIIEKQVTFHPILTCVTGKKKSCHVKLSSTTKRVISNQVKLIIQHQC